MKNLFYKAAKPANKLNLAPKLKVTTKGYINLVSRRKGATAIIKKGITKVRTFASRKALKAYQFADQLRTKAIKAKKFAASFLKSGRIESHVLTAKDNLKKAIFNGENSYTIASYYLQVCRAVKEVAAFKFSLPKYIRVNLF